MEEKFELTNIFNNFKKQYKKIILTISLLAVSAFFVSQYIILNQKNFSKVINIAGRQRMLSQRIIRFSNKLETIRNQKNLDDLKSTIAIFKKSHLSLKLGNPEESIPAPFTKNIQNHYLKLDSLVNNIETYVNCIINQCENIRLSFQKVETNGDRFLKLMDETVNISSKYVSEYNFNFALISITFLIFLVFFIMHEVLYVLKPLSKELTAFFRKKDQTLTLLKTIEKNAAHALITASKDGVISSFNKAAEKMLGHKADEIIGKESPALFHDLDQVAKRSQEFSRKFKRTIKPGFETFICHSDEGLKNQFEWTYIHKNGHKFPVSLSISTLIDNKGENVGYLGIAEDLTEKKEIEKNLKESESKFRSLFDNSPDAHFIMSATNGQIIDCNKTAVKVLNGKKDDIIGLTPDLLSPTFQENGKSSKEEAQIQIAKVLLKGVHRFEWLHRKFDGEIFPCDVNVSLITYDNQQAFLVVWRDISENKKQKEALINATKKAKDSEKSKSLFLANMSHEIRTPMNGIIGVSDLLKSKLKKNENIELARLIYSSGNNLLGIINDILDFSKIEAGQFNIEKSNIDLYSTIQDQFDMFTYLAREKAINLHLDIDKDVPQWIISDSVRIRQVINNFFSNALKFTSKGEIVLKVSLLENVNNKAIINFDVKDSGIGIKKEDFDKLFKNFSQVDLSATRKFGGTGLGLSINKTIVDKLGGEISFTSIYGEGSTFSFTIESEIGHEENLKSHNNFESQNFELGNPRILSVDDDESNRIIIGLFLKQLGLETKFAKNGKEAIEMIKNEKFDLVLMDCQMPIMDGYEATKKIHQEIHDRPTIIALTASTMKESIKKCQKAGMDGFISKPFTIDSIKKELSKYIFPAKKIAS